MSDGIRRLVVVSNRLPVTLAQLDDIWTIKPGAGGLVTALAPVLRDRGGTWIGWSGDFSDQDFSSLFDAFSKKAGYQLVPIDLDPDDIRDYYQGFSNEVIWPLFHDFQTRCNFSPKYWSSYLNVNQRFAEAIAGQKDLGFRDYLWVHDYHLMHVARKLKAMGENRKAGFFLHIPFPPADIFLKLPWRSEIIGALMDYNLVGFQTVRDRRNFVNCLRMLMPEVRVQGRGGVITATLGDRVIRLGAFPISIDFTSFANTACDPEVGKNAYLLREAFKFRKILLGVDRLDYSKGIPERIEAVRTALRTYPELREKINFIQIVVPSRENVGEYQDLKTEIEQLVGQVNGEFSQPGWVPIHYHYRSLPRPELVAYYRAADIALVTPLKDGMNLVAKEYCVSNIQETGTLILSEFAGAASQLQRYGATLVNPYDSEGVAKAIHTAFHSPESERKRVMSRTRDYIRRHNISWWVDSFLQAAFSRNLQDFSIPDTVYFKDDPEGEA